MIGPLLIAPPLYVGTLMLFLGLARDEKPQVGKMLEGFHVLGKSILVWYAMYLFSFLWSLLLTVLRFIKMIFYMLAPYIIAGNPEMSAIAARCQRTAIT